MSNMCCYYTLNKHFLVTPQVLSSYSCNKMVNKKCWHNFICLNLFLLMLERPNQQQWSCRDVASILWDFYPKLGCHDTQNVLQKYNHPNKSIRLICLDGLTYKPYWLRWVVISMKHILSVMTSQFHILVKIGLEQLWNA